MNAWIKNHPVQWWALVGAVWLGLGVYTLAGGSWLGYVYIVLGLFGLAAAAVVLTRSRRR